MHALDQARARYGIVLVRADLDAMIAQIMAGKAVYVRHDGTSDIYLVKWKGIVLIACYSPEAACIKTFLPPDSLEPKHRRAHCKVKRRRLRPNLKKGHFRRERDERDERVD